MEQETAGTGKRPGEQLPARFGFTEADEYWIGNYLYKRLTGRLTKHEKAAVPDCDLYGEHHPWEIWKKYGGEFLPVGQGLLFFTRLKSKGPRKGVETFNRTVREKEGSWKRLTLVPIQVRFEDDDNKNNLIKGKKKRFFYDTNIDRFSDQQDRWIINEYTLESNDIPSIEFSTLCLLSKKDPSDSTSTGQGNAEKLVVGSANKNKRKLNEYDDTLLDETGRSMKHRYINDGWPPNAAVAPVEGFSTAKSCSQETTGPAGCSFSTYDSGYVHLSAEEAQELESIFNPTASSKYPQPGYPTVGNWYQSDPSTISQTPRQTTGYDYYRQQPQVGSAALNLSYNYEHTLPVASRSYNQGYRQQPPMFGQNFSNQFTTMEQQGTYALPTYEPPNLASQLYETGSSEWTQRATHPAYLLPAYTQYGANPQADWSSWSFTGQLPVQPGYDQTGLIREPASAYSLPAYTQPGANHQADWGFSSFTDQLPLQSGYDQTGSISGPASAYSLPDCTQSGANPQADWISSGFTDQLPVQSGYDQTGYYQTAYGGLQQSQVLPSTTQSIYGQGGYSLEPMTAAANYVQGTYSVSYGQLQPETQQLRSQPAKDGLSQPLAYGLEAADENPNADHVSDPAAQGSFPWQS